MYISSTFYLFYIIKRILHDVVHIIFRSLSFINFTFYFYLNLINIFKFNDLFLNLGLNMFLVPQVSVNFRISPSMKLYGNLVLHL